VVAAGPVAITITRYLSERFLREVVSGYSRRVISRSEAAEMIGVKPKNFDAFQDLVLRGAA
jgi:hypothetical protein